MKPREKLRIWWLMLNKQDYSKLVFKYVKALLKKVFPTFIKAFADGL